MILTTVDKQWIWILPKNREPFHYASREEQMEHNGKWVITGEKAYVMELAFRIDPLVEEGKLDAAKFTKKNPETDPLPQVKEYAMCVYADDRQKGVAEGYLLTLGVSGLTWKYDKESIIDWSPGGSLAARAAEVGRSVNPLKY